MLDLHTGFRRHLIAITYVVYIRLVNEMFGLVVSMINISWQDPLGNFTGIKDTVLKRDEKVLNAIN